MGSQCISLKYLVFFSGELKNELNPGKVLTLQVLPLNDGKFLVCKAARLCSLEHVLHHADSIDFLDFNFLVMLMRLIPSAGVFRIKIDEMGAAVKRYEVQDVLISDPKSRLSRAQWTVDGSTARLVNGERWPCPPLCRSKLHAIKTSWAGPL